MTVLFQGSSQWVDWKQNIIPIAADILDGDSDGRSVFTELLKFSAQMLCQPVVGVFHWFFQ